MLRATGAAIAGTITLAVLMFVGLTIVWMLFGPAGSFEPASWVTSTKWDLTAEVVLIVSAVAGGYLCAMISPGGRSLGILVGIIIVLGAMSAVAAITQAAPTAPRPDVVTMFEAMGNARAPLWTAILNPIIEAAGAVFGSRLRGRPASEG